MFKIDASPHQAMARFEDAAPKVAARFRSVHGKTASGQAAPGVRFAVAA